MKKNNSKSLIIVLFCFITITIAIGIVSIVTSSQAIYSEAVEKMFYMAESKSKELIDVMTPAEITVNNLSEFIEGTFSAERLKKEKNSYLKEYFKTLTPVMFRLNKSIPNVYSSYFTIYPNIARNNNYCMEIWIINKNNSGKYELYETSLVSNLLPLTQPSSKWFYTPMKTGKPGWSEPYEDQDINVMMISYTTPIYADGKFIGVAGMDISMEDIEKIFARTQLYETGNFFLLDKDYKYISGNLSYLNKNSLDHEINQVKVFSQKIKQSKHNYIEYNDKETQKIMTYLQMKNGFQLIVTVPKSEIMHQQANIQILMTGITLLGVILAAIILLNV
jgi:methyl-accepting chemotaxis protein